LYAGLAVARHQDLWLDTERQLGFRLVHDFLMTEANITPSVCSRYRAYVSWAYDGLCTAASALGVLPLGLAGELRYLRPPKTQSWYKTLHLGS
jgi:hypothetical protein